MKSLLTIMLLSYFSTSYAGILGPLHSCTVDFNKYLSVEFEVRDNFKALVTYKRKKDKKFLGNCQLVPITLSNGLKGKGREIKLIYSKISCSQLDQKKYPIKKEPTFRLRQTGKGFVGYLFHQKNRHPLECRSKKMNLKKWTKAIENFNSAR